MKFRFSAPKVNRRNRADLIGSATPCREAQVVGPYRDSNPLRQTVLAAMSEDCTTAPQHLQVHFSPTFSRVGYHLNAKILEPGKEKFLVGTSPYKIRSSTPSRALNPSFHLSLRVFVQGWLSGRTFDYQSTDLVLSYRLCYEK